MQYRKRLEVKPTKRLSESQVQDIHKASMALLYDPGVECGNEQAAGIFKDAGCIVERKSMDSRKPGWIVRFPEAVIKKALESAPEKVVLGARNQENSLLLEGEKSAIYFGTGSETNIFLESALERFVSTEDPSRHAMLPVYKKRAGAIEYLCRSAHLMEHLPNVDFFIRNVNIQTKDIESGMKDVNVFFASLMHTTKHIQGGVENIESLESILRLARIAAEDSGSTTLPVSFIACPVKSPLQMVEDTSEKVIKIAKAGVPLVLSSSPQGGSTAPIQEEGIVAQINAEILAGVALAQLSNPGTPVLYGAVPVRARLDNLHDFYGAPEFSHYNTDCVQLARHYGIPCYSTAGVADSKRPGLQATVEKLPAYLSVGGSGAQYIHYAFGLLDRTSIFSPLQAVIDNAMVGLVKDILRPSIFTGDDVENAVAEIRTIVASGSIFARKVRKQIRRGVVSDPFELASDGEEDDVLQRAQEKLDGIYQIKSSALSEQAVERIYREVSGLADREKFNINAM